MCVKRACKEAQEQGLMYIKICVNNLGLISTRQHDLDGYFNVPQKERNTTLTCLSAPDRLCDLGGNRRGYGLGGGEFLGK